MPSVLIRMLTVWHVLFWLNVFWSECLDSLTTSKMLCVSGTHERDGREEALYVVYLLAVTRHGVSEHESPCRFTFSQPLEHKGFKTIGSKAYHEWITGTMRSVSEKVIHPAKGRRQE